MWSVFLSAKDTDNIAQWRYNSIDNSITTILLTPFWNFVTTTIPATVSPNVISLCGLLCVMHAAYLTHVFVTTYPAFVAVLVSILLFTYQTLDAVDGKHARQMRAGSPLGELFDHACDNVGIVFLVPAVGRILGVSDLDTLWYATQSAQLLFLTNHLSAFKLGVVKFSRFSGPGELIVATILVLLTTAVTGTERIVTLFSILSNRLAPLLPAVMTATTTNSDLLAACVKGMFYVILLQTVATFLLLPKQHLQTKVTAIICLVTRTVPAVIVHHWGASPLDVISDGLFMSVLTSDIIVAKMAKRQVHPLLVILSMLSVLNPIASLAIVLFYYLQIFSELSAAMNISVFSPNINVYIDGIFDLCHVGHKNHLRNALSFGNRVLVGVVADKDAGPYKRAPIMTTAERCAEVAGCKYVSAVIPDAPCNGITEEFLAKHNIHVVAHSPEYDRPEDHFYAVPRRLGITRTLPRTDGISTSELIHRCKISGLTAKDKDAVAAAFPLFAKGSGGIPRDKLLQALAYLDDARFLKSDSNPSDISLDQFLEAANVLRLGLHRMSLNPKSQDSA